MSGVWFPVQACVKQTLNDMLLTPFSYNGCLVHSSKIGSVMLAALATIFPGEVNRTWAVIDIGTLKQIPLIQWRPDEVLVILLPLPVPLFFCSMVPPPLSRIHNPLWFPTPFHTFSKPSTLPRQALIKSILHSPIHSLCGFSEAAHLGVHHLSFPALQRHQWLVDGKRDYFLKQICQQQHNS